MMLYFVYSVSLAALGGGMARNLSETGCDLFQGGKEITATSSSHLDCYYYAGAAAGYYSLLVKADSGGEATSLAPLSPPAITPRHWS